jgi:hypothetical protein
MFTISKNQWFSNQFCSEKCLQKFHRSQNILVNNKVEGKLNYVIDTEMVIFPISREEQNLISKLKKYTQFYRNKIPLYEYKVIKRFI